MIMEEAPPVTRIKANPAADGRQLRQDELQSFERGYKAFALDYYMVCTGKTGAIDIDDDRFKLIQALNDQIESWRNKQMEQAID